MEPYKDWTMGFEPESWLADERNLAISDGNGSFNLLQYEKDGIYNVHTFYKVRGREALSLVREAIRYTFDSFPVEVMKGLTPVEKKGALWLTRQAGFTSYGTVETPAGECELFILTRTEYYG